MINESNYEMITKKSHSKDHRYTINLEPKPTQEYDGGHHQIHQKGTSFYNVNIQYDPYNPEADSITQLVISITDQFSRDIVKEFETIHDKLMHLIIVNKDLSYFAHIHPIYENSNNLFTISHKFPESGEYKMWIDFKPKKGSQTLVTFELKVLGNPIHNLVSIVNNRQFLKNVEGPYQISLTVPNEIRIDEDISIKFNIFDASGNPITDLEPLMGAGGHSVIISNNVEDFLHVHPTEEVQPAWNGGPEVSFKTRFSIGGLYKVWGQFQHKGRVITVDFILEVA